MKSAIYNGPRAVEVVETPAPGIGDNDVLIENLHAGICGSDVSAYLHGPREHKIAPGGEFGHEMISRVAAVGRTVTDFALGDRVYPYPLLARGDMSRAGTLGGFSEFIAVPSPTPGVELYPVSDSISDTAGALIEPFTVALNAARRANPASGERAIVFGAGTIGIGVAICLKHLGAQEVLIVDLSDFRLDRAAALGFLTCNSSRDSLNDAAIEAFGEARSLDGVTNAADVYVDATGAAPVIDTFQRIGKVKSRLVVVGVHAKPVPINLARLAYSQHDILGSGGYTPEDVVEVMALMESGKWDIESIVTHEFALDDIETALKTAADPSQALNVAIVHDASRRL